MSEYDVKKQISKIVGLMYVSFAIWIFIIIYQLIVGIVLIAIGYGVTTLICMVYNIVGCVRFLKTINYFKNFTTEDELRYVVNYYEKSITPCWIFMFVNLIFGGFIGFVGNLYDLILAYWVKNRVGTLLRTYTESTPVIIDVEDEDMGRFSRN
ncbi:MAG: hypothetical protein K5654_09405 [Lachnospiraceae bacterium]|nr:hypothetical protein [Lachnospiraceae bacterium]